MVTGEMSPYLLLGFLIAGILHVFVPGTFYHKYLSRDNKLSVLYAALLGIPLPLCSCGVIPTAIGLRNENASKGAVASFLIATPQTGIDSILATFSMLGLGFAVIRPAAALITGVCGGLLVNRLIKEDGDGIPAGRYNSSFIMRALNPLSAYDGTHLIYWTVFIAACLFLGIFLIKKRKAECAQTSFAYYLPCYAVKLLIAFCAGMFLGITADGTEYLSCGDADDLAETVDVRDDDLLVSRGLFIPVRTALYAIRYFAENGQPDPAVKWIKPEDLPEDGNYII